MNIEIKDYIIDELDNNELTELIYSLVLYHRDNTIMNDDKFSSRIIRFAYKNVLYDFKQKTILDEKKKQRAEINRQNALKRWGKTANTIGDAIAYANEMQKLCKSDANRNINKMQDVSDKNISNEITIQKDIPVIANDNTNNNIDNDAEDMRTRMQNVCKSDAKVIQNNFAKHTDNKEENIIINNTNDMQKSCEINANDNANKMQTEYENYANNKANNTYPKSLKSLLDTFVQQHNKMQAQKEKTVFTEALNDEANAQNKQKADTNIEGIKSIGSVLKKINLPKIPAVENKTDSNKEDMQEEMQNICESNVNENAIAYAKPMRKLCKNNANIMRNYATENSHKPFDMKKEIELFNKLNSNANSNANGNANCNANDYANEYANDYANEHANEHTNNIEDKVVPCSSENKENTIPASDLKPVSYASEKGNILSVDNLLNDDDGSINEETDLSVQKIKEKEKRNKKEKENIYNNIYNNKYIYNNIFKEEKENLIKEKEESILSSNQDVKQAELESDSVSMQKENQKIIQSQPSVQPDASDTKPKRFKAPSVDEVKAYITEKGYSIDAEAFVDYYTSKGWVVGKSPMKDWKAAVRTWNNNNKKFNSSSDSSYYANNRPNRMLTPNEIEAEAYAERAVERLKKQGILTDDNRIKSLEERYGYNEC